MWCEWEGVGEGANVIFGRRVKWKKRMEKMMIDAARSGGGGLRSGQKNALDLCTNNVMTNIGDMGDEGVRIERGTPAERVVNM